MAKGAQKITLTPSRDISFDRLVLSQSNVRRIKAGVSVEELAEDIARRGRLQSLSVRPVLGDDGTETGKFEIPAGGRRFQTLSLQVRQKRLAKTTPIPCIVRDAGSAILAEDDSLAENMQRVALHRLISFARLSRCDTRARATQRLLPLSPCRRRSRSSASNSPPSPLPCLSLCRGWHDAGAAHGLHREPRSRASGSGLGCDQFFFEQVAISDPAHADRDLGSGFRPACSFCGC